MCIHCDMDLPIIHIIDTWGRDGLTYTSIEVLARPTAEAHPNTYVFILRNAVSINGVLKDIYVDVHYEGGQISPGMSLVAIGGLWIRGIDGSMKPTQHEGKLLKSLRSELPNSAPALVSGVFGRGINLPQTVALGWQTP